MFRSLACFMWGWRLIFELLVRWGEKVQGHSGRQSSWSMSLLQMERADEVVLRVGQRLQICLLHVCVPAYCLCSCSKANMCINWQVFLSSHTYALHPFCFGAQTLTHTFFNHKKSLIFTRKFWYNKSFLGQCQDTLFFLFTLFFYTMSWMCRMCIFYVEHVFNLWSKINCVLGVWKKPTWLCVKVNEFVFFNIR